VSVRHHPADAILADYAAGALRPGFALVTAAHLESCAQCRRAVRLYEGAAGGMLEAAAPADLEADALSRMMARLDETPQTHEPLIAHDPRPLLQRLPLKRRRYLAPNAWVQQIDVPRGPRDLVYLLHVGAGMVGLDHTHSGPEFTTVLSGALHDTGEVFAAGDFVERDLDHSHRPHAVEAEGDCLCIAATEGPLKARDWLGNLIRMYAGV
jgi:putative transcriptional regulator